MRNCTLSWSFSDPVWNSKVEDVKSSQQRLIRCIGWRPTGVKVDIHGLKQDADTLVEARKSTTKKVADADVADHKAEGKAANPDIAGVSN